MAGDAIDIKLNDAFSAFAAKIEKSLDALGKAGAKSAKETETGWKKAEHSWREFGAKLQTVTLAFGLLKRAAASAWGAIKMTASAVEFRRQAEGALKIVTGSSKEAKETYEQIVAAAQATGLPKEALYEQYLALKNVGLSAAQVKETLAAVGDLEIFSPGKGKALSGIAEELARMAQHGQRAVGGLELGDMFEASGLKASDLGEALGLKGTDIEIRRQLSRIRLDVGSGINAINKAVTVKTGKPLGSLTADLQGDTITGKLAKLGSIFEGSLSKVDMTPIYTGFDHLMKAFSDPKRIESITKALNGLVLVCGGLLWSFDVVSDAVTFLVNVFAELPEGLREIHSAIVDWVQGADATISGWIDGVEDIFSGAVSGFVDIGKNLIGGLWSGITGAWTKVTDGVKGLSADLVKGLKGALGIHSPSLVMKRQVGFNVAAGVAEGITAGAPRVDRSMLSLSDRIAKPGPMFGSGVAEGITAGAASRPLGLPEMARPIVYNRPHEPPAVNTAQTAGRGGKSSSELHFSVTYNVDEASVSASAKETISELRRQVTNIFREMAVEAAPVTE